MRKGTRNIIKHGLLIIIFVLLVFAFKYDVLDDPYHWDALGGFVYISLDMYDHNFRLLPDVSRQFGHPPLFYLSLALAWKIFGYSISLSHVYVLILGALGLFFTYKIGEKLFDPTVGIAAATLLFFNQLFFAQIGTLNDTMPVLTVSVMAVYFYLQKKRLWFILSGALAVAIKETNALLLLAIFLHFIGERYLQNKRIRLNDLCSAWFIIVPLTPLFAWFAYQKLMIGWAFRTDLMINAPNFMKVFGLNMLRYLFYDPTDYAVNKYNFIISGLIMIGLPSLIRMKKAGAKRAYALFTLLILINMAFFSLTPDLPRYFTIICPFFYIAGAGSIFLLLSKLKNKNLARGIYVLIIGTCVVLFISNYYGDRTMQGWLLESNMEYLDLLETHGQAAQYIESAFPDATVITFWPMSDELTDRRKGYVTKEIDVLRIERVISGAIKLNTSDQLIVYYSPQASYYSLLQSLDQTALVLIKRFECRNKYAEIYLYSPKP
jgi:4-amino-4-deoxy-L-arabinose transferase-like glycosyltransferase